MVIDLIFGAVVLYGFYVGYQKGIIRTIMTMVSLLIGFMAAVKFTPSVTLMLEEALGREARWLFIVAFLLVIVMSVLIIRMIVSSIEGVLKVAHINIFNRLMGGAMIAGFGLVVLSYLVTFGKNAAVISKDMIEKSVTYPVLEQVPTYAGNLTKTIQPVFQEFWGTVMEGLESLQSEGKQE